MPTDAIELMGDCDVCKTNKAVGVSCSPFGPVTFCYCRKCTEQQADPEFVFEFLYKESPALEDFTPLVSQYNTFKDGKYMTVPEWWEWRKTQPAPAADEHHPLDDAEYPD